MVWRSESFGSGPRSPKKKIAGSGNIASAPYIERLRGNQALSGALTAITAAVVGVIASLAVFFLKHVAWPTPQAPLDLAGLALAVVAGVALIRFKQGVIPVILACALAGWALKTVGWAA